VAATGKPLWHRPFAGESVLAVMAVAEAADKATAIPGRIDRAGDLPR